MTYIRPIDTPTNPNWAYAEEPLDLIPRTNDPTGAGQRMVDLCSLPTLTQGQYAGQPFGDTMLPWQRELIRYIWGHTDANGDRDHANFVLQDRQGRREINVCRNVGIVSRDGPGHAR